MGKAKTWLIRKADLRILRPVDEETLIQQIESGVLTPNDEVCVSKGYWFYLSDIEELRNHLGDLDLRGLFPQRTDEVTSSTDTKVLLAETEPGIRLDEIRSQLAAESTPDVEYRPQGRSAAHKTVIQNWLFVASLLVIFGLVLVLIWSGSY